MERRWECRSKCRDTPAGTEALTEAVTAALRQQVRRSAHPSDQAALRLLADRVVRAVEAEFLLLPRHEVSARLTERGRMSAGQHE